MSTNKDFLERLEKNRNQEQSSKDTFGGIPKTSFGRNFVEQINKIEKLTKEEREILMTAKISESEKHLKSIRENVLFFFWMYIASIVIGVIIIIMNTK